MPQYQQATADTADLGPQLNALLGEGVLSVVLFSSDGLPLAATDGLSREAAERSCAAFAGMHSLQQSFAEFCQTTPASLRTRAQTMDFVTHTVLLLAAGRNSGLALAVEGGVTHRNSQLALSKALKLIKALEPFLAARDRQLQRA
ncbi:roadblock/LC7 domain-containing protein [Streptomyces chiangmaiensis]|uniref:roadblock/LC7 domain-containing protein n=1 Tax=Streptomyces chiangmaiensis TaxID=766497 RepID=UPI0031E86474